MKGKRYLSAIKLLVSVSAAFICFACSPARQDKVSVTFKVLPRTLAIDSSIYLSGNIPQLGEWQMERAVKLEKRDGIWNSGKLYFDKGTRIEYKFTQGSWESEALDEDGNIPANSSLIINDDTVITVYVPGWSSDKSISQVKLDSAAFDNPMKRFFLPDFCRYQKGDNLHWASAGYPDTAWQKARMSTTPWLSDSTDWTGTGWFRIHLSVDSIYFNRPLAIMIDQLGASEFYINGKLAASFGKIPSDYHKEEITAVYTPHIIKLDGVKDQVLAIRYFNSSGLYYRQFNFFTGLAVSLMEPKEAISWYTERTNRLLDFRMLFAAIPLVLALIHFSLFTFYRDHKADLYYSICLFSFSIMTVSDIQRQLVEVPSQILLLSRIYSAIIPAITLFGLLAAFSSFREILPPRHRIYSVVMILLSVWGFIMPGKLLFIPQYAFISICVAELIWIMFNSRLKSDKAGWLPAAGFGILGIVVIYNILLDFRVLDPLPGIRFSISYGFLCLMITMSIYQSLESARKSRSLKEKLAEVQDLSERMLQQEKATHLIEMEHRLLEADNERKTRELEEARDLQLSMLPKAIPSVPGLQLAVFMQTATEVGGDYYDFHLSDDNTITVAVGDATGHGTKAGTMVTVTKSLFNEIASIDSPVTILHKFSSAIKRINLPRLYMSLSILKIHHSEARLSSAGMPPLFRYSAENDEVSLIISKSMPLGSFADFPYKEECITLHAGDVLLLMTDGFIELFNREKEMLDTERAQMAFAECCRKSPEEIIHHLCNSALNWRAQEPQHDDMTFLVIRKC